MPAWFQTNQPRLLMICHRFPDMLGSQERMRVWQLLRLVSRAYQVYLVSLVDGPISLVQWRPVQGLVHRLELAIDEPRRWLPSWWTRWLAGTRTPPVGDARGVLDWAQTWTQDQPFDVVLGTHPRLLKRMGEIHASCRVCDVFTPGLLGGEPASDTDGRWRIGHASSRPVSGNVTEHGDLNGCDIVTINAARDRRLFPDRRVVCLPLTLDTEALAPDTSPQRQGDGGPPVLVFHGDWLNRDLSKTLRGFRRRVWSRTGRVLPQAMLGATRPHGPVSAADLLRGAWAVVVPGHDVISSTASALQAMAMRKPVVICPPTGEALGLRHGHHALIAQHEDDWSAACVRVLESPTDRYHLSQAGWRFAQGYRPDERAGRALLDAIQQSASLRSVRSLAA